jgi:hypothetical protein
MAPVWRAGRRLAKQFPGLALKESNMANNCRLDEAARQ